MSTLGVAAFEANLPAAHFAVLGLHGGAAPEGAG